MNDAPGDVRNSVENLLYTYARLADELDVDGIANLMARATLKSGGESTVGRDAIIARLTPLFSAVNKSRHLMSNIRVEVGEDGTTARAQLLYDKWEIHDEPVVMASGRYVSEFMRDADGWHFTSHEVQRLWRREDAQ